MASKGTEKTLQKLRESVHAGKYYEAQQMYRTVARRFGLCFLQKDKNTSLTPTQQIDITNKRNTETLFVYSTMALFYYYNISKMALDPI